MITDNSRPSSQLIGRLISNEVRVAPLKCPIEVVRDLKEEFGVSVNYHRVWMGVECARQNVFGDYSLTSEDLCWYVDAARASNPDSIFNLERAT